MANFSQSYFWLEVAHTLIRNIFPKPEIRSPHSKHSVQHARYHVTQVKTAHGALPDLLGLCRYEPEEAQEAQPDRLSYDHGLDLLTPVTTESEDAHPESEASSASPQVKSAPPAVPSQPSVNAAVIKPEEEPEAEKPESANNPDSDDDEEEEDPLHWSFKSEMPPKKVQDVEAPEDVECGPGCQERRFHPLPPIKLSVPALQMLLKVPCCIVTGCSMCTLHACWCVWYV